MLGKAIFLSCLSISMCQNLLVQRTLPGRVSHHQKTVTDGFSTVHRHHTQATNPRVQLVQQSARFQQEEPVLLQHADGRFFALNANLQAGQYFQTADGRIFTLAASEGSAAAANLDAEVLSSRDASSVDAEDAEETDAIADDVTRQADNSRQQPTSSPSLFGNSEIRNRNLAAQRLNTPLFRVASNPVATHVVRTANAPVTHVSHLDHSVAAATPTFISARTPVAQLSHFDHAVAAPQFVSAAPTFVRTASPFAAHHVAAAPSVVRTADLRTHQLADSGTSVFQGFYSFPNAGIDFNF